MDNGKSVTQCVEKVLPGAKIIKCLGYLNGNTNYSAAKRPFESYKNKESLTEEEIQKHLSKGGWIGAVIPRGFIVIDVDILEHASYLVELLRRERFHHHLIKTPRGYQFIFKATSNENVQVKMISHFFSSIGIVVDTRVGTTNSLIVFPTYNTEGRFISQITDHPNELPWFLRPVWNAEKTKGYEFSIPMQSGSRNQSLYDFGRRLKSTGVPMEQVEESMLLIYKYFYIDKDASYTINDVKASIASIGKLESNPRKKQLVQSESINNDIEKVSGFVIPEPYLIKHDSLYRIEVKKVDGEFQDIEIFVSRNVPFITKYLEHIEKSEIHYEISWRNKGKDYKETVPAGILASRRELLALADKGLSCNDSNSKHLIEYFDLFIGLNEIPTVKMVNRLGDAKGNFIHLISTKDIHIVPGDGGEQQLLESFQVKGTVESWIENVFNLVKDHPKAVFPLLASFASVILHEFDMKPIVVDVSGESSSGKSGLLLLCASVWGSPKEYIGSFNLTKVAVERRSAFLNSYPQILDDSNGVNDTRMIQTMIYQFVNNIGKLRGSITGSQHTASWRSIMITSGENEILAYAEAQGVAARVIPITKFSFEGEDKSFSGKLYTSFTDNHGAIGVEFLNRWKDKRTIYSREFEEYRKMYLEKSVENDVARRISLHYSFIVFIGKVLNDLFNREGLEVDLNALEALFYNISNENKAVDRPLLELEQLLEEIDSNRNRLYVEYEPTQTISALYHNGELYLTPAYIKESLGVNAKQIRSAWLKRNVTVTFKNKDLDVDYTTINKRGRAHKGILINKDIIKKLGFDFSTKKF
ncbi:hypothetical protein AKG34_08650 [Peribacillus butanolivorans]|uniref:DUF927 domain-containing protein n=1 Tax=Peribacillus butanolivorans TaxID=421767 RepID=UPI0006A6DA4C|nr:DUF927 domain-containing protein [Peribacillus butanolivorans]KON68854.1 hypothetical protein AKG34_08650 [Peribacillus butanolivorans]